MSFIKLLVDKVQKNVDNLKTFLFNFLWQESLESEKSAALSEMSRGKAGAVQTLKDELDRKLDELKETNEREKKEMRVQWEEETNKKLQSCEKDKQVILVLDNLQ